MEIYYFNNSNKRKLFFLIWVLIWGPQDYCNGVFKPFQYHLGLEKTLSYILYIETIVIKEEQILCWRREYTPNSLTKMIDLLGRGIDSMFFTGFFCVSFWVLSHVLFLRLPVKVQSNHVCWSGDWEQGAREGGGKSLCVVEKINFGRVGIYNYIYTCFYTCIPISHL